MREAVSNKVSLLDDGRTLGLSSPWSHVPASSHSQVRSGSTLSARCTRNTIEGFWSLIKRGIMGSFHKVSRKYLPLYVAEFQFRYNNRHNPDIFGEAIAGC